MIRQLTISLMFLEALTLRICAAQDIVYSVPYPNGIVTENLEKRGKKLFFNPIDNSNLFIVIWPGELISIINEQGKQTMSDKENKQRCIVFQTDRRTGKITYTDTLNISGKNQKEIYEKLKMVSADDIRFKLLAEDVSNKSYLNFQGETKAYFAGDKYSVTFMVKLNLVEEHLVYTISDLEGHWLNIISIDALYGKDARNGDVKKFWTPLESAMQRTVEAIEMTAN